MITLFAHAGGLLGRADLPIPDWLFGWAAAMVLFVSFVALAVLWPEPKLERDRWRPLPRGAGRVIASRPVEIVCGLLGVAMLGVVVYTGFRGTQSPAANFAPTFVFVNWWVGLVPLSVLFGDVFRAFNPWRAIGRGLGWTASRVARGGLPAPLRYPERLGHWPAAAGVFAFVALELVKSEGDKPETIAIATLVYSAITFVAMALYGVEAWCARGEAFSVYFNLFSRISPWETRNGGAGPAAAAVGARPSQGGGGDGGAAGGDDRLGELRRRGGGADLDEHRAGHLALLPGSRALAGAGLRADVPARAQRGDRDHRRLLLAGDPRCAQRGRRVQRPAAGAGVRALAGADRAGLRDGPLPDLPARSAGRRSPSWRPTRSATAPTCSAPPPSRSTTA